MHGALTESQKRLADILRTVPAAAAPVALAPPVAAPVATPKRLQRLTKEQVKRNAAQAEEDARLAQQRADLRAARAKELKRLGEQPTGTPVWDALTALATPGAAARGKGIDLAGKAIEGYANTPRTLTDIGGEVHTIAGRALDQAASNITGAGVSATGDPVNAIETQKLPPVTPGVGQAAAAALRNAALGVGIAAGKPVYTYGQDLSKVPQALKGTGPDVWDAMSRTDDPSVPPTIEEQTWNLTPEDSETYIQGQKDRKKKKKKVTPKVTADKEGSANILSMPWYVAHKLAAPVQQADLMAPVSQVPTEKDIFDHKAKMEQMRMQHTIIGAREHASTASFQAKRPEASVSAAGPEQPVTGMAGSMSMNHPTSTEAQPNAPTPSTETPTSAPMPEAQYTPPTTV